MKILSLILIMLTLTCHSLVSKAQVDTMNSNHFYIEKISYESKPDSIEFGIFDESYEKQVIKCYPLVAHIDTLTQIHCIIEKIEAKLSLDPSKNGLLVYMPGFKGSDKGSMKKIIRAFNEHYVNDTIETNIGATLSLCWEIEEWWYPKWCQKAYEKGQELFHFYNLLQKELYKR